MYEENKSLILSLKVLFLFLFFFLKLNLQFCISFAGFLANFSADVFMKKCHFRPELSAISTPEEEEEVGGFAAVSQDNVMSMSACAPTDPVLTQPGLGSTTTTITTITQTGGDWSSGLFDVCGDMTTCMPRKAAWLLC